MISKFKDIQFNNETLKLASNSQHRVDFKRACDSPKYLIIDWRGVRPEEVNLNNIDMELLQEYVGNKPEFINNKAIATHFMEALEKLYNEDGGYLWFVIVDDERIISDELFQKNTFAENMDVLFKMTKFKLPLE